MTAEVTSSRSGTSSKPRPAESTRSLGDEHCKRHALSLRRDRAAECGRAAWHDRVAGAAISRLLDTGVTMPSSMDRLPASTW